jgi:predicted ATP-grasp superfamily ATP-dependent carboligase
LFFQTAQDFLVHANNTGIDKNFILQEYVQGYNMGCYVVYKDGRLIGHTMQRALLPGRTAYEVSMGMEFIQNEEVITIVDKLMRALNWNGFANIDLRFDESTGKVLVLEINPRFSFTLQASLKVTGVNFAYLLCQLAQGQIVTFPVAKTVRYVPLFVLIKNTLKGTAVGIGFSWKEIDFKNSLQSLLPRLYMRYNKKGSGKRKS